MATFKELITTEKNEHHKNIFSIIAQNMKRVDAPPTIAGRYTKGIRKLKI